MKHILSFFIGKISKSLKTTLFIEIQLDHGRENKGA